MPSTTAVCVTAALVTTLSFVAVGCTTWVMSACRFCLKFPVAAPVAVAMSASRVR
ncbi:hypothetical protein [Amycolatopsis thermoflava]|uniref:hypothetical protein n=1 Tax=Amycolatopsis thermoflava TaxID=84480 RepID=UPI00380BE259